MVRVSERPPDRLLEVGLVEPELPDRPAHTHLGTHELGGWVDPEPDAYLASLPLRDRGEAVELIQGLHVYREDPLLDGHKQLFVGFSGAGEDDVLRSESRGPHHHQLAGGGYLGPGELLARDQLTHGEVGVGLDGVSDLHVPAQRGPNAAYPLRDHLPVIEVEGCAVLLGYPTYGHPCRGELPFAQAAEASGQSVRLIYLRKHYLSPCGRSCRRESSAARSGPLSPSAPCTTARSLRCTPGSRR